MPRPVLLIAPWILAALASATPAQQTATAPLPTPEAALGHRPGADGKLIPWKDVVAYLRQVDEASPRVALRELGQTTQGRPFLVAIVSSDDTIQNLDRYRDLQRRLADPTAPAGLTDGLDPVRESKTTVLVTCTIHSSETASTPMALELLHQLATGTDDRTIEILDNTILLLVPSVNPDGVDLVHDWYERSKGHPWEGSGMPWLYHPYAGHDTNRDWFMLNLKETQLLTRFLYHEWFPTITWDVHQMGSTGARLFVPPFYDPVNPNLHPRLSQSIALIGTHMAAALATEGKKGILTAAMYDNWWNGGNRTVPQRHNMVGLLTEAASVKMATPIFLTPDQLKGASRGFPDHQRAVNFPDPWPGGWWRLRDIVDYELTCAYATLTLAARYRDWFQSGYRAMALDAVEKGKTEPPHAWLVRADQRDPGTAAHLVHLLRATGVKVNRATKPFAAAGVDYPAGTWIIPAAQPYRPYVKDLMERQVYPDRLRADGAPEKPYDVAGWTLPLQMGVEVAAVATPFEASTEPVDRVDPPAGRLDGPSDATWALVQNRADVDLKTLVRLLQSSLEVRLVNQVDPDELEAVAPGALLVRFAQPTDRETLAKIVAETGSTAAAFTPEADVAERVVGRSTAIKLPRVGVYQPWNPSMDEGWTRLVLERYSLPYTTLHNEEIRAGRLNERFDTILIPSIDASTLREGYQPGETEPAYVGGLGREGADALRAFVQAGGTLVTLENASTYAIEELGLPVKNALAGVRPAEFFGPGSILRVEYDQASNSLPLVAGMPASGSAYFSQSLAFDIVGNTNTARVAARYAPSGELLQSGWLLGASKLQGKPALVEVDLGQGRVILFGFPPQHRAQPVATFRLLLNALFRTGS